MTVKKLLIGAVATFLLAVAMILAYPHMAADKYSGPVLMALLIIGVGGLLASAVLVIAAIVRRIVR